MDREKRLGKNKKAELYCSGRGMNEKLKEGVCTGHCSFFLSSYLLPYPK